MKQAMDVVVEYMNSERFESPFAQVIKQFEGWESCIEHSCHKNSEFRSLCEDYAVCARALENWQASDAAVADQRQKEYSEWLTELEQEIHSWLEQQNVAVQSD